MKEKATDKQIIRAAKAAAKDYRRYNNNEISDETLFDALSELANVLGIPEDYTEEEGR